jgi:hypothetical protein
MIIREKIWAWLRRNHPAGRLLTRRLLAARAILFPIEFLCWRWHRTHGYQLETDTWLIGGVRYAGPALAAFARAQGEVFRMTRAGDCITVEEYRFPRAMGVGRVADNAQAVLVMLRRPPTDDELRALHDLLRS